MSKHTPGPWEWYGPNLLCGGERQSENILNSADDGRPYGHHAALIEHHWDGDVAKANAHLIAAAPDMLAALHIQHACKSPEKVSLYDEEGVEGWRWTHPDGREWTAVGAWDEAPPMHPVASAAIAKAEGK